jgi:oligoendopeptidase F
MAERKVKKRSETDRRYHWHIEDLYRTKEEWQRDFDRVKEISAELSGYEGRLSESAGVLGEFLRKKDEAGKLLERVYVYANQKYHEDTSQAEFQQLSDLASGLMSIYYGAVSFMEPELLEIPEETLWAFEREDEYVLCYDRYLKEMFRQKKHTLSKEAEGILAESAEMAETASNVFSMFNNADVVFPVIKDEDGEDCAITHARYMNLMQSDDRRVRKDAFFGLYHTYENFKNTLGASYIGNLKKDAFYTKVRKYGSSLERALDDGNIPQQVYHTLIETVHKNMDKMYRYMELRKKVLGLNELHLYDVYVPMTPDFKKAVSFEEAKEIVKKALEPLGEEYGKALREGLEGGWIDVYENEGKRSGAYSWGAYGTHPFVLLNYQDKLNDVFTLAHEMGHALHSCFSDKTQPYPYAGYKIFVAEVASTCNEALLMDYLLKHSGDKKEKAYLINYFLEQFRTTLYRQTMFAEFELKAHEMQESGEGVTADKLCRMYLELNELYFGKEVVVDREIAMEWARIPHFYTSYYVYQYATGYAAAIALSRRILKEGGNAVRDYLEFLRGGSSKDPVELLKGAGVDMTSAAPLEEALRLFGELIEQYEQVAEAD